MKKWVQKAVVQKVVSYLPFNHQVNFLFQKYVTKGVYLTDEYFSSRLEHATQHLKKYQQFSGKKIPASTLEIGTGWYPVVPVCFFLSGVEKIYSVDITFLTSKKRIETTLRKFVEYHDSGKLTGYLSYDPDKYQTLLSLLQNFEQLSLDNILHDLRITYKIEDARQLSLPDGSIDLVNSNNTFEHIYPVILHPILKDFKRVVKKQGGVMSHSIDMSDHFAHFDKSINIYNFLRFSDREWIWIDNSIQPQSRLRITDYRKMYEDLQIPVSEETFREGNLLELKTIPLDKKYAEMRLDDVAISHCHFVSDMSKGR
ncbi:MAG: class I SAM-dependent methyltransferase [Bacteroidetes bacterium]|nr:class I SAM-dependent methyltransferase [Bacteroidota bacterium]